MPRLIALIALIFIKIGINSSYFCQKKLKIFVLRHETPETAPPFTPHCKFLATRLILIGNYQRWSGGLKARGQAHKKKCKAKAKDSSSEDRPSRGQGLEC